MTKKDAKLIISAIGKVLRAQFGKRDDLIATLQQRVDALEKKLAKLVD